MPFDSLNDQRDYITNFYSSLYKLPETELPYAEGAIENFLGPEMLNHPVITNSKLTPAERARLEAPLTLDELDSAIASTKTRTAAGPDGISNAFIKNFGNSSGCLY